MRLTIEAAGFSETSVSVYQPTRCNTLGYNQFLNERVSMKTVLVLV
jgi:hypothetical protein